MSEEIEKVLNNTHARSGGLCTKVSLKDLLIESIIQFLLEFRMYLRKYLQALKVLPIDRKRPLHEAGVEEDRYVDKCGRGPSGVAAHLLAEGNHRFTMFR